MMIVLGILAPISRGEDFKSLKINYAAKASFVERLSKVQLTKVSIEALNLSAAISDICNGDKNKDDASIVQYVITFPTREIDADPFSDNPIEQAKIDPLVTYRGSNVSFVKVLDLLCSQAGYVWSVADNKKGRAFILIEYKG